MNTTNEIKHLFVSFELALMLKENGFDEPCFGYYIFEDLIIGQKNGIYNFNRVEDCLAPTYQQVIDWFREKHKIEIYCLEQIETDDFGAIVALSKAEEDDFLTKSYGKTYYEALKKAILEALKLISKISYSTENTIPKVKKNKTWDESGENGEINHLFDDDY